MEKFQDSETAKQDIINSPDVTEKTVAKAVKEDGTEAVVEVLEPVDEAVEMEKADRNARIVSKRISKYIPDIDSDEADALSDGAETVFRFMAMSGIGRVLSGVLLFGAFAAPFVPRIFRLIKRKQQEEEEVQNGNG